jgi:transposase
MRPKGSAKVLEDRRRRALSLLGLGLSLNAVARKLACAASSVMRWRNSVRRRGEQGLKVRSSPGRPAKLTRRQLRRLVDILTAGALRAGYRTELWTMARIAKVIRETFGVKYHRDHIGRLMHRLGWSHQKPERRAVERDEEKIEEWTRTTWARVKKTPRGWAPTSSSRMNPGSS